MDKIARCIACVSFDESMFYGSGFLRTLDESLIVLTCRQPCPRDCTLVFCRSTTQVTVLRFVEHGSHFEMDSPILRSNLSLLPTRRASSLRCPRVRFFEVNPQSARNRNIHTVFRSSLAFATRSFAAACNASDKLCCRKPFDVKTHANVDQLISIKSSDVKDGIRS